MRRVVVTGMGAVSALGLNQTQLLHGLQEGTCGIRKLTVFDCREHRTWIAGQVPDFEPEAHFNPIQLKRLSRCDQLALIATKEALAQSRLLSALQSQEFPTERFGVVLGAGAGGSRNGEVYYRALREKNFRKAQPSLLCAYAPSCTTDVLASTYQLNGPRSTIVTACSSSNTAIGYAADRIRSGEADIFLSGGADGLCELTYTGFNALKAVSPHPCKPFDRNRDGLSLGEAAGILVLEELEHAQKRNATILAEFLSYGIVGEGYHMTAPEPQGKGAAAAMQHALRQANLKPKEIDYISAHGTATTHNDIAEARAICAVFSENGSRCPIPLSAPKSMLGHCLGAAGAIEAVALIQSLLNNFIPPTIHHDETDPECGVDCVPNTARQQPISIAMSNSFAFGGNNTAIILKEWQG